MTTIRIALAQINPTVGDFAGNTAKIIAGIERARDWRGHRRSSRTRAHRLSA